MPRLCGRTARGRGINKVALTIGAAALLAVTACTSSGSTATTPPGPAASGTPPAAAGSAQAAGPIVPANSTLHWHACAGLTGQIGIRDCTMLSVPLDYADPGGVVALEPDEVQAVTASRAAAPMVSATWLTQRPRAVRPPRRGIDMPPIMP